MLNYLSSYLFVGTLLSMVYWFYQDHHSAKKNIPTLGFLATLVGYIFAMIYSEASLFQKLLILLPRDVLAFFTTFLVANNLKKGIGFLFLALLVGVGGYFVYHPNTQAKLLNLFQANEEEQVIKEVKKEINGKQNLAELAPNGELLFDIKSKELMNSINVALSLYHVKIEKAFPEIANEEATELDDYYRLDIPTEYLNQIDKIMTLLYNTKAVDWIERNEVIKLSPLEASPVKTLKGNIDYGINDPKVAELWGFEAMEMDKFYQFVKNNKIKPKKKAKIAILDTGVDSEHEDIKANFVSTRKKYDKDKQNHGTHCAGIAASVTNNGKGIASFALNNKFVEVTSVKVLNDWGMGTQDGIIKGILEAADKGADVISMSLGGPSRDGAQKAYEDAIRYANKKGAVVIVAAGNSNEDALKHTPANCKGVICVSAVDVDIDKAHFSNHIKNVGMGIAAPGKDILSTIPNGKYAVYSGTSMATPYVAGLAGMLKSINPQLKTKELYKILNSTGKNTKNNGLTGKMIYPLQALKAVWKP